jgi:hypothetical protein
MHKGLLRRFAPRNDHITELDRQTSQVLSTLFDIPANPTLENHSLTFAQIVCILIPANQPPE